MRLHFTLIGILIASLLGVATLMHANIALAQADEYRIDFDSVQTGVAEVTGGDYRLQGGLTPVFTLGESSDARIDPLVASAYCGNGVRENGESCDGTDIGGSTCQSIGYAQGSLQCSSACVFVTSGCTGAGTSSSSSSGNGGDNGGGGGRQHSVSRIASSSSLSGGHAAAPRERNGGTIASSQSASEAGGSEARTRSSFASVASVSAVEIPDSVPTLYGEIGLSIPATTPSGNDLPPSRIQGVGSSEHPSQPGMANAIVLGSMTFSEAGILARLAWIARMKNIYGVIPAFIS